MFNGERKVLYYADALTEIAFVVPSLTERPSPPRPSRRGGGRGGGIKMHVVQEKVGIRD